MLKKEYSFTCIFVFIIAFFIKAQTGIAQTEGKITFVQDPKINDLVNRHIEYNKSNVSKGFRIKIYSGIEKNKAKDMKAKFQGAFPDVRAYEKYDQPNFTIRVGNFKTKLEAFKFLKDVQQYFPTSFIVQDEIDLL